MKNKINIEGVKEFELENGRVVVKFLDYQIVNSGNGDGWVLTKKLEVAKFYETHLGNFSNIISAKEDAIRQFMIARPQNFSAHLAHMLRSNCKHGAYMNYYMFKEVVEKLNMVLPDEIECGDNLELIFNGKKF